MGMENIQQETTNEGSMDPTEFLAREKTILEKFGGNARKIARVMALVSALSTAPGLTQETYAQQIPDTKTEQVEKENINEENITESGEWAKEILEKAESELTEIETKEDVVHFINSNVGSFMRECYFPTKGDIKQAELAPNLTLRRYSVDDLKLIVEVSEQFKIIIQGLNTKYNVGENIDKVEKNLADIGDKASTETSYSSRKQAKASSGYIILRP